MARRAVDALLRHLLVQNLQNFRLRRRIHPKKQDLICIQWRAAPLDALNAASEARGTAQLGRRRRRAAPSISLLGP